MKSSARVRRLALLVLVGLGSGGLALVPPAASASARRKDPRAGRHRRAAGTNPSLYSASGFHPGPAILYQTPATAAQLTNSGIWHAAPILVSGATAYRGSEFLYQDYLYDDHGARELPDPTDPRAPSEGDLFSKPNGTYTYPTGPGYGSDAADLVEFRIRPMSRETALRVTLNTLENPGLIAFSVAIGGTPGRTFAFPDAANVVAPAVLSLTVHPLGSKLVARPCTPAATCRSPGPRRASRLTAGAGRSKCRSPTPTGTLAGEPFAWPRASASGTRRPGPTCCRARWPTRPTPEAVA
ncbi:MAG: hypothetical protein ACYC91_15725 [Solirubrobacteraceae bacterium]